MTFKPILPHHLDSTMLTTFRSCEQRFFNEFVRGARGRSKSQDLHAGACFALALERVYRLAHSGIPTDEALASAFVAFTAAWGEDFLLNPKNPKTPDRVWAALEDYIATYGLLADSIQPYRLDGRPTFEYSFAIPLAGEGPFGRPWPHHPESGEPFIFCGRFDLLGEYNGQPIVRDEKTAKAAGDKWADQWNMRGQFLGYLWACRQQGLFIENVCVRGVIILKESIRQLQVIRQYPNDLVRRWAMQLHIDLERIIAAWKRQRDGAAAPWNMNFGDACTQYGGCQFVPLCEFPENTESWLTNFEENRWNPLLRDQLDPSVPT